MNIGKCGMMFAIERNKHPKVALLFYNKLKDDKYLASMVIHSQTKSGFKTETGSMYSPKKEFIENLEKMNSNLKLFDAKQYTAEKMNAIAKEMNASFPETFFKDAYTALKKMKTCPKTRKR
jgi:hypothetical protein